MTVGVGRDANGDGVYSGEMNGGYTSSQFACTAVTAIAPPRRAA